MHVVVEDDDHLFCHFIDNPYEKHFSSLLLSLKFDVIQGRFMSLKKYKYFIWNRILKIINQIFVKNNDLLIDIFVLKRNESA